eukprot:3647651-Rhodomonas_salina.1
MLLPGTSGRQEYGELSYVPTADFAAMKSFLGAVSPPTALRVPYAMSVTEVRYDATRPVRADAAAVHSRTGGVLYLPTRLLCDVRIVLRDAIACNAMRYWTLTKCMAIPGLEPLYRPTRRPRLPPGTTTLSFYAVSGTDLR